MRYIEYILAGLFASTLFVVLYKFLNPSWMRHHKKKEKK